MSNQTKPLTAADFRIGQRVRTPGGAAEIIELNADGEALVRYENDDCSAGHGDRLFIEQGHIQPYTRRFNSLTRTEAQTIFALAFGYAPLDTIFEFKQIMPYQNRRFAWWIGDGTTHNLCLNEAGQIWASTMGVAACEFNALKVINYLNQLGIEWDA